MGDIAAFKCIQYRVFSHRKCDNIFEFWSVSKEEGCNVYFQKEDAM
jgi:hypothetical protein